MSLTYLRAALAFCLCLIFSGLSHDAWAQNKKQQKALKKEWKTRAKEYVRNPLSLKAQVEGNAAKIEELTNQIAALKNQLKTAEADRDRFSNEVERLKQENETLRNAYEAARSQQTRGVTAGLIFKVQVGAFRYFDMSKYLSQTEQNFEGENADNLNRYTMGNFRDLEMAENFRKDVQRLGIKDAWIVPYLDGQRIEMKQAKQILQNGGPQVN